MEEKDRKILESFRQAGRSGIFKTDEISNAFLNAGSKIEKMGKASSCHRLSTEYLQVTLGNKKAYIYYASSDQKTVQGAQGLLMLNLINSVLHSTPA